MSRNEHFAQGSLGAVAPSPPPEQKAILNSDSLDRYDQILRLAMDRTPGLHLWRSEDTKDSPEDAKSVGIHWTANPSQVVNRDVPIWHAVLNRPETAIPRDHPMWLGINRSMPSEAEVRINPGEGVHVLGRFDPAEGTDKSTRRFAPFHPDRHTGYTYTKVDREIPAEQIAGGQRYDIDYSDVGLPAPRSRQFTDRGLT